MHRFLARHGPARWVALAFAPIGGRGPIRASWPAAAAGRPDAVPMCPWTYQKSDETRVVKLHDLVTVLVDEKSIMESDNELDRKKTGYGDLKLPDWILLKGLRKVVPRPAVGPAAAHPRRNRQQTASHGTLSTTEDV